MGEFPDRNRLNFARVEMSELSSRVDTGKRPLSSLRPQILSSIPRDGLIGGGGASDAELCKGQWLDAVVTERVLSGSLLTLEVVCRSKKSGSVTPPSSADLCWPSHLKHLLSESKKSLSSPTSSLPQHLIWPYADIFMFQVFRAEAWGL